jgi:hypothetical protein
MSDPDAPEELGHFIDRMLSEQRAGLRTLGVIPGGLTRDEREFYGETLLQAWKRLEREKTVRRKEKERLQRGADRKKEREEEQERRNPTPIFQPADYNVEIPYEIRDQHIFVPGGTRRGKSSQLLRMIMIDIENGAGVTVLDPKGDLITSICYELANLPQEREVNGEMRRLEDDCIYLDLKTPIPLNLMEHTEDEKNDLISNLIYIVTKGDQNLPAAEPLLERTLRTILEIPGTTFLDIFRFFTDKSRQRDILKTIEEKNPLIYNTWDPFPTYAEYRPITRRVERYTLNPTFKTIFGTASAAFSISNLDNS